MSNLAAVLPAEKAPFEVQEVENYQPGPDEILVKNEVISLNPVEYKVAKYAIFPLQYPYILGSTLGGTVEAVGSEVKKFQVGDKVVAFKKSGPDGNQYGAYQRHVVVKDFMISKLPNGIDQAVAASVVMNIATVVGMYTGRIGLDKPSLEGSAAAKNKKVLIYGGSSSFGSLSVEYLARAGYSVVTTTSPKNKQFVEKLGAATVLDHTMEQDKLVKELITHGPYEVVVDSISLPNTIPVTSQVLAAQGGGKLYTLQPPFGPEELAEGVERVFESWPDPLYEERNDGVREWLFQAYLPEGLSKGFITPLPVEKVSGGLKAVNEALDKMEKGVSGVRLVVDPWE